MCRALRSFTSKLAIGRRCNASFLVDDMSSYVRASLYLRSLLDARVLFAHQCTYIKHAPRTFIKTYAHFFSVSCASIIYAFTYKRAISQLFSSNAHAYVLYFVQFFFLIYERILRQRSI